MHPAGSALGLRHFRKHQLRKESWESWLQAGHKEARKQKMLTVKPVK